MTQTQDEQLENNKPIDWELCLKLVNNKADLAKDMLAMFVAELPETKDKIKTALQLQDSESLQQVVHKLHGGACYCGVPRIKFLSTTIEAKLKTEDFESSHELIERLLVEIDAVLTAYQQNDYGE